MEKLRKNQGITLIALIITIIILIILAGVSIAKLTGQGLFERANEAKLKTKRAQISEWLNLKLMEEQSKNIQGTPEDIINATKINVENNKDELYKMGKIVEINNVSNKENGKTVDVYFYVVVDGDIYKVCLKGVKFIGESGNLPPTIETGDIIFTLEPSGWTNGSVTVTAQVKEGIDITGFTLQTSKDGTNYTSTASQTFTANGTIYARIVDSTEQYKGIATRDIGTIDKADPTISTELKTTSIGINSISLNVGITDANSGLGKVEWYYGTTNNPTTLVETTLVTAMNTTTTGPTTEQTKTYTVTGLVAATTYYFKVIAYDVAGNSVETTVVSTTTIQLLSNAVSVGDYVAYDAGTHSYTSPVGTGPSHGNGNSSQTFTSNSSLKWRVLSKDASTGEVVLISEEPIGTFTMKGGIGYLYAEQELNEICKIYGYGTGADTSKKFNYVTGDTIEGTTVGTVTGSGARSINVDDINKICGVTPSKSLDSNYGTSYTKSIYYPTIGQLSGKSKSAVSRTDIYTAYSYVAMNTEAYEVLFGTSNLSIFGFSYWLASRSVTSGSLANGYCVRDVYGYKLGYAGMGTGYDAVFIDDSLGIGVRPIVYLKSSIQTNGKNSSEAWNIIDK